MPGNEIGDRVHNFFEQEHLSQGQHHSQIADANWAVVNNNRWDGSQRQFDALSSKIKDYNPQQSDLEGRNIHSRQVQYGLNSLPPARPESANNRFHNQHPDLNGNIYGHQFFQRRPDEANLMGVGTESDRNNSNGRGFSMYGPSQGSGPEHPVTSGRMDSFESPVSYDFFGGQPKMSDHPGMLQSLPQQQSGFSDMHQQLMFRKMQELQRQQDIQQLHARQQDIQQLHARQQDIQQLHARQQHSVKQVPVFTRQVSGKNSHDFINGTPVSDASHPWTTEMPTGNTNWLHPASAMQGSTGGLMFSPGQGQASNSVNLVRQQVDQSLPGVPISSLRDNLNQYQFAKDKSLQKMATYNNSFQSNHYAAFPQLVSMKDEHVNSRQGFQGKDLFGHTSHQVVSRMNLENLKQRSSLEKNVATQEFQEKQEMVDPPEISHDKIVGQAPSSQNSIALDPAEEKILFGSDDNSIWNAFGKKTDEGTPNLLDGMEFMNGLPSIQSGSWSALMQSAVAETSSSDVGLQEDWTNLSIQNPDLSTGNHQTSSYDAGKHHTALVNNNLPISSAFTFGSVAPSDDANSYHNRSQGLLQFGHKVSEEHVEGLQSNSSHRPIQQSTAGGSNWLKSKNQSYGSASYSVDADMNERKYSNHSAPSQNGSSRPSKPYNYGVTNGLTPNGDMPLNIHENENHVRNYQKNGQKRVMREALNVKDGISEVKSLSNSSAELEQLRSTTRSSLAGCSSNAAGALLKPTKSMGSEEASFPDGWKPMETSVKTQESENSRKLEHLLKKGRPPFHSSEEEVNMHVMDTVSKKENHNASYRSNMFNHIFTAGPRESNLLDASDPQSLAGGKQKSSNQVGRKSSGPRKFQYHPMGNLDEDVEPSYQMKQANYSEMMPLHNSEGFRSQDKGFFGQSKLFGQFPKGSTEKGKGQLPDHQGDTNRPDELSFKGNLPGYGPEMSSAIKKSLGMSASHSRENMLELLHKVDQSKGRSTEMHLTSTGYSSLSQTPETESSDGTGGCLQDNQSSAAQGFSLQLAPPSQRPGLNHVSSSPSQTVDYSSWTQATVVGGDKGQRMLDPTALGQSMPSPQEVDQREFKNKRTVIPGQTASEASPPKMQENFSSDYGFSYQRSQLQDQLISKASGQVSIDSHSRPDGQFAGNSVLDAAGSAPYDNTTSSLNISRPTPINYPHGRVSAEQISAGELLSVSQSITTTGISQKGAPPNMLSDIWPNVPPQQQYLGAHGRHAQPKPIQSHQSDFVESTFSVPLNLVDQGPTSMDDFPSDLGTSLHPQGLVCERGQLGKENSCQQVSSGNKDLMQKINESPRKEPDIRQLHREPPLNPPSTQRDIEAFGRTLKPNNFIQQNFSLVNQIRAMKNVETDPSNRGSKRPKGPDNRLMAEHVASRTGQPYEGDVMVEDPPFTSSSVPSTDPKMHCFSEPEGEDYGGINASSHKIGKLPSQDMLAFNQIESENFHHGSSTASVRTEHPSISPQMTPSWFNQYGSFKNGQMLQVYDASKAVTLKTVEQPFRQSFNNLHTESQEHTNVAADTNEISNKQQNTTPALLAIEHLLSLQSSPPEKRKCATFELQSWQKEVSQSCPDLQSLRVAEENWAKAANRISEKVEDDVSTIEDGLPMPSARRRLSLTRQLMQLLFSAPPAVILSAEARSNYETVAYFVARRTLGDTCSLMSCSDRANLQAYKRKTSDRSHDQHTSQVTEDFMGRVRKLETELSRLDKRASVSDLKIEVQDVEKISIINRFAMFHSRLQADGANTSSFPGASANSQKPFPQRFVTAVPLPRNLPDSVQCLSL